MRDDTLSDIGMTLDRLTSRALVILKYENPKGEHKPQAAALIHGSQEDPPKAKNPGWQLSLK